MTRYRAYSRYNDKSETRMLILFLVVASIIFLAVIGVQAWEPTQCGPIALRGEIAPPEIHANATARDPMEIPLPGPADYFAKPRYQIRII